MCPHCWLNFDPLPPPLPWLCTYFMNGPWNIDVIHSVVNHSKEFWHLRISLRHTKCNIIVHGLNTSARAIIKHTFFFKSPGISLSQPEGQYKTQFYIQLVYTATVSFTLRIQIVNGIYFEAKIYIFLTFMLPTF